MAEQFRGQQLDHTEVLNVLCAASEYDELPVRHNEDVINTELARKVRLPVDTRRADDPHVKAHLLLQAHMARLPPPISDYLTDTRGVLDNSIRLAQVLIDVAAQGGCLGSALAVMELVQSLVQARWMDDNSLTTLPHIDNAAAGQLARQGIRALPQLLHALQTSSSNGSSNSGSSNKSGGMGRVEVTGILSNILGGSGPAQEVVKVADRLRIVDVYWKQPRIVAAEGQHANGTLGVSGQQHHQQQHQHQQQQGVNEDRWLLEVDLIRGGSGLSHRSSSSSSSSKGTAPRVYAPLFPKVKQEGWWVVVGHRPSMELLALKRVSFGGKTTVKMNFPAYTSSGTELHTVTVFLISDCYMGLDQQYDVVLNQSVATAAARAEAAEATQARTGWVGGAGSSDAAAAVDGPLGGDDVSNGAGGVAASRRARRQQQLAARQQHAAEG